MKTKSTHDRIYNHLAHALRKGEIGQLLPTEAAIAARLHVNKQSVSRAMSALKSQGYIERKQGRGSTILKHPHKEVPGILSVLPGPASGTFNPYFSGLMQVIAQECVEKGFINAFTGCPTGRQGDSFDYTAINALAGSGRYQGAIILDTKLKHPPEWLAHFQYPAFPVVWLSMTASYFDGINSVDIDNRDATIRLVEHLHAKGYRRIGYLSYQLDTTHSLERLAGYKQGIAKLNLELNEEHVLIEEDEYIIESGYKIARRLAGLRNPPEAYIVAGHELCHGVKRYAIEHGLSAFSTRPVATYDYKFTGEIENAIVSVSQPFEQMARESFELLLRLGNGKERPPSSRVLKAVLITADGRQS